MPHTVSSYAHPSESIWSELRFTSTEPPNSRVWVSIITTESFGSVRSLVKGWTPDSQGVFTDDLNRAPHQLAPGATTKLRWTEKFENRLLGPPN